MHSTTAGIAEAFEALDSAVSRVVGLSFDALGTRERLEFLERLERQVRRLPVARHALINGLAAQATEEELGDSLASALADRLRITKAEAGRRIAEATDLGERRTLTGEPMPPTLPATAAAQRNGELGDAHIRVIRHFMAHLPDAVDVFTRDAAEADLASKARDYRPDQVADYGRVLMDCLHPDGDYTDEDRARRRGLTIGNQEFDGMSRISGLLTPQARATLEAALAKLAAPGMNNPLDQTPILDGEPSDDNLRRDTRSQAQRNHDGLTAGLQELLASEKLGQHNGLPTTVIVTTTLKDLEKAAGHARTAGGTLIPMADLIRMAAHAHHYLAIFDGTQPLQLRHAKRLANTAQRLMLLATHGGCTRPGCDVPGYWTQVHHTQGWATTHRTDIETLTLACGPDNRRVEQQGWTTHTNTNGKTEWTPPPNLDHGQPRTNTFHHPKKLLNPDGEDDAP